MDEGCSDDEDAASTRSEDPTHSQPSPSLVERDRRQSRRPFILLLAVALAVGVASFAVVSEPHAVSTPHDDDSHHSAAPSEPAQDQEVQGSMEGESSRLPDLIKSDPVEADTGSTSWDSWTKQTPVSTQQDIELHDLVRRWQLAHQPVALDDVSYILTFLFEDSLGKEASHFVSTLRSARDSLWRDLDVMKSHRRRVFVIWDMLERDCRHTPPPMLEYFRDETVRFLDELIKAKEHEQAAHDEVVYKAAVELEDWTDRRQRYPTNEEARSQQQQQQQHQHQHQQHLDDQEAHEQQHQRHHQKHRDDHEEHVQRDWTQQKHDDGSNHHRRHRRRAQEEHHRHQRQRGQAHEQARKARSGWRKMLDEVMFDTQALGQQVKSKARETWDKAKDKSMPWVDAAITKVESMHKQLSDKLFSDHDREHEEFVRRATKKHRREHHHHHEEQRRTWHREL